MAINPIDLLKEQVTPQLITQSEHDSASRSAALDQFYPILLGIFSHQNHAFSYALEHDNATFLDIFPEPAAMASYQQLLEEFSRHHNLSEAILTPLFNRAVPLSAQALNKDVGDSSAVLAHLKRYLSVITEAIPAWAVPVLSTLGLAGLFNAAADIPTVATPSATPKHMGAEPADGTLRKLMPWVILVVLLLLLLLLWRACQHQEPVPPATSAASTTTTGTTSTTPVNNMSTVPASLAVTSGTANDLIACRANIGNTTLRSEISNAINSTFNAQPSCRMDVDQTYATTLPGQDKIATVLDSIRAVPNASMQWVGDQITVNTPNSSDTDRLVEQLRAIVPEVQVTAAPPLNIETEVNRSVEAAQNTLAGLRTPYHPADVARALNLQIINFAIDSDAIPEANQPVLDQAASIIRQVPDVALTIEGYTDSMGSAAHNQTLSQKRAQSVANYLISHGVDAGKLTVIGNGQNNPVADNVTELGKFRNRRIEFKVTNTDTGNTRTVDEQTAETSTAEQVADGDTDINGRITYSGEPVNR